MTNDTDLIKPEAIIQQSIIAAYMIITDAIDQIDQRGAMKDKRYRLAQAKANLALLMVGIDADTR